MKNRRVRKRSKLKPILFSVILSVLVYILIPVNVFVFADSEDEQKDFSEKLNEMIDCMDFDAIEEFFNGFEEDIIKGSSFKAEVVKLLSGKEKRDFKDILSVVLNWISGNVKDIIPSAVIVLLIAVISGLFSSIGFNSNGVKDAVFLGCYAASSAILFADTAKTAVDSLSFLSNTCASLQSVFPIVATVSSLCGENNKISVMSPVCSLITQITGFAVLKILIPATIGICALSAVSSLSEKSSISSTRDSIVDVFKWVVGIFVSILSFFTGISGLGGSVRDGITLKTLKYTVGNTIPIIGGFAKEGVDVVITAAQVIKNATGVVFMTSVVLLFVKQILRLCCFSLMLSILNALCMPFSDKRYCDMIDGFKKTVSLIIVIFVAVTVLFFLSCYVLFFLNIGA